jgi:hypothetical protein
MTTQEGAEVPPKAVEVGAPPKQDEEVMAAIVAAQKAAEASPTAVEAGRPLGQDLAAPWTRWRDADGHHGRSGGG